MTDPRARGYYDEFSQTYEDERGRGYHGLIDDLEINVLKPYIRGARVLEGGCGTGLILERIAKEARFAAGFDLSPGMVARAQARGLNVLLGSVTQVPFADDSFDVVCSFKVLAHVPDIRGAVKELTRVTRPGGHVLLEFYNPASLRYLAKKIAGPQKIGNDRTEADVHTRWDTPGDIARLLPPNLELVDFKGVRVFTPAAFVHKIPRVAEAFRWAEERAVDSPLRKFGGFLVAIARKTNKAG